MRNPRVFWGTAVLLLGVLLLLQNMGVIQINVWNLLWPLLIIFLGIQLLFSVWQRSPGGEQQHLALPVEDAREAYIVIEHGAGRIKMGSGTQPGELVSGDFNGGVIHTLTREGAVARLTLKMPDVTFTSWPFMQTSSRSWDMRFTPDIPLDILLKTGASESVLDLGDSLVRSLRVETGASSTTIHCPQRAGYTRMDLHSGAASIDVGVPQGIAARIEVKGALSSTNIDRSRFPQSGNIYQSPDYLSAANRVDIQIESGVGSVTIH